MNEQEYITIQNASKVYGIPVKTFRKWDSEGRIKASRTPTNYRIFKISDIEEVLGIAPDKTPFVRDKIIYCRVSSHRQKDDLERQIDFLKRRFPDHSIVQDVGSGINFNRKGLQSLLVRAMSNQLQEVVVAHKDRLSRFAFELIEFIFKQNGVNLIVLDEEKGKSDEQELSEDLLAIVHVFSCKQMGKRRYRGEDNQNESVSNKKPKENPE